MTVRKPRRPSDAQLWILCRAAEGARVVAASGYQVHQSFAGKPTYYGAPAQAHAKCVAMGWLADDQITESGRDALQIAEDALTPAQQFSQHGDGEK